jgi:formylmethanofuran dehydrogenase subunit B
MITRKPKPTGGSTPGGCGASAMWPGPIPCSPGKPATPSASTLPQATHGEFTGPEMLARQEVDACLIIGGGTVQNFPPAAMDHLRNIPVILLDSPGNVPPVPPKIHFETAVYGIHRPGTAYRMDEVPIPLRMLLNSDLPSDAGVLNGLLVRAEAR